MWEVPGRSDRSVGRRSVSSRVALELVLVVLVACLIPIPVVYLATRAEWDARIERDADEMAESLERSLEFPLWELDDEGARAVARAYVESGAAECVRVWDADGNEVEGCAPEEPGLVWRRRTIRHRGTEVGAVEVAVSPRFAVSAGRRILGSNVAVMLVVAVAIAGAAFLLVGRHIRRPLETLGTALDRLADGDYDVDPGGRMPWEFRRVIERFRRMAERIQEREAALAEANRRLEREVGERTRAEERYRALFENAVEGMFVSTPEGRFLAVNPALAELFGYASPEEMVGSVKEIGAELFVNPADRHEYLRRLEQADVVRDFEFKARRRDGEELDVVVSARAMRNPGGHLERIQGFVWDMTQQRRVEAQLVRAQKMEAVGTLAGGVAHDFNNLLQGVLGYAEVLRGHRPEDPVLARGLERIQQAALRGRSLTEQLLAFSRGATEVGDAGRRAPVDVNAVIRSAFELLGRTLPRMIRVELDLAEPLGRVRADPVQLEQVILNLAINARDAMPEGGVLTVGTRNVSVGTRPDRAVPPELPPGRYVEIRVSDTGHGMPADVAERVFEPFFTTKEVGKGTGLGLSVAYGIVRSHGGTIVCESAPGRGARFNVFLPAWAEEARPGAAPRADDEAPAAGGGETVLVVDDDDVVRDLCREVLEEAGYRVIPAPDGETALELYRARGGRIDLVLLDLNMPGMGGARCLEELLREDPAARVLVATGYGGDEALGPLGVQGACAVLRKPYRAAELLRNVERVLRERDPGRA